jgi:hypothetical protein
MSIKDKTDKFTFEDILIPTPDGNRYPVSLPLFGDDLCFSDNNVMDFDWFQKLDVCGSEHHGGMVDSDHGRIIGEAKNKTPMNKTEFIGRHPFLGVELDLAESIFHDKWNSTKLLINVLMGLYVHHLAPVSESIVDWEDRFSHIDCGLVPHCLSNQVGQRLILVLFQTGQKGCPPGPNLGWIRSELLAFFWGVSSFQNLRVGMFPAPHSPLGVFRRYFGEPLLEVLSLDAHKALFIRIPKASRLPVVQYKRPVIRPPRWCQSEGLAVDLAAVHSR